MFIVEHFQTTYLISYGETKFTGDFVQKSIIKHIHCIKYFLKYNVFLCHSFPEYMSFFGWKKMSNENKTVQESKLQSESSDYLSMTTIIISLYKISAYLLFPVIKFLNNLFYKIMRWFSLHIKRFFYFIFKKLIDYSPKNINMCTHRTLYEDYTYVHYSVLHICATFRKFNISKYLDIFNWTQ